MSETIAGLDQAGHYRLVSSTTFPDVILCRIRYTGELPVGSVKVADGECVVAFSRLCTHLGCHTAPDLPANGVGLLPMAPNEEAFTSLVVCPCHFSCFDLGEEGLCVLGPATDCLPQVALRQSSEPKAVELVGWMIVKSVPYGVPYGGTSQKA